MKIRQTGYFISKQRAVIILLVIIVVIIIVGLMAGLIGKKCSHNGEKNEGDKDGQSGGDSKTATTEKTPEEAGVWQDPFLPSYTIPVHYNLSLYPDFYHQGNSFTGQTDIVINVTQSTQYLIVHYKLMNITNTQVTDYYTGETFELLRTFGYERNQYWITEVKDPISSGSTVVLHLEFQGSLLNGIVGFYKSTYINSQTQQQSWLATTKFQPTDARKAFPNFDEPHQKATFTITMKHWTNFTALSNMPVRESMETEPGWSKTTFEKSVPMSSYLVCFIVCDFKYTENFIEKTGVSHKVWAAPDMLSQTEYALRVGKLITDLYEEELNMTYHLPKLDQIAIPDFPSGAMEHWGLITYRETSLLYDEQQVSVTGKERVTQVIAHELAHNYFGNVITCNWWDEIWLNEGFARYYQYAGMVKAEPYWQLEDYFAVATQQAVMRTDASPSSRPVVIRVTHPDQINMAFDGITYNKGGSMLRMMETFMGNEKFIQGLRIYLKSHLFGTVVTQDFWDAMQQVVGDELNITAIMNPWLYQMGLPVVNITIANGQIYATQMRLLSNPDANPDEPESPYRYKWYIPLTYQTQSGGIGIQWLNMTQAQFANPSNPGDDWIKFNRRQGAFYRVNYPTHMWRSLMNQLVTDHTVFLPIDRSNLLDDAFNLARATHLDYPTALNMTSYMSKEDHYFPWNSVKTALDYITSMLYGHKDYYLWRRYIKEITTNIMEQLEIKDEGSHLQRKLRTDIIRLACNEVCLNGMIELFQKWIQDPVVHNVAPTLRQLVYGFGLQQVGKVTEWEEMWSRYVSATSAQEKSYILYGLAQTKDIWLMHRYLSYCMDEEKVRRQDFFNAIGYLSTNRVGNMVLWNYVREHYDELVKRFGVRDRYFGRMVPHMISYFKTPYQLKEVESFFAAYPDAGAGAAPRQKALEDIRANIAWLHRNEQDIIQWLYNYYGISQSS